MSSQSLWSASCSCSRSADETSSGGGVQGAVLKGTGPVSYCKLWILLVGWVLSPKEATNFFEEKSPTATSAPGDQADKLNSKVLADANNNFEFGSSIQ